MSKRYRRASGAVLVGMPGSGKSTIGKRLADALDCDFYDSDREIENAVSMPIERLIRVHGEARFRVLERNVMLQLLARQRTVVATGGGAVLDTTLRSVFTRRNTIWLDCCPTVLAERLQASPRVLVSSRLEHLKRLHSERSPCYAHAAATKIETGAFDSDQSLAQILALFDSRPPGRVIARSTDGSKLTR